jgi:uncharacterized protein (DUF58 family)
MSPIPTGNAVIAFFGCLAMLGAALLSTSPTAVVLTAGALLGLASAFALTLPLGAKLRRERLEFSWSLDRHEASSASTGVVAGVVFELRCQVHNRGAGPLRFAELVPVLPAGVTRVDADAVELLLPARTRTDFALRLRAASVGRVVLQGLAVAVPGPSGLFLAPLYFPSPLAIRVLPRSASPSLAQVRFASNDAAERAGPRAMRQRGSGTELYELREHQAGDAFKSIAWKPSARVGKLLVREVEREVQDTLQLVLDVSGSMRGGDPGARNLDRCIELCALVARQAIERGDRIGLLTIDGRIVSRVAEGEGMTQLLRIYEALLATTAIVDADLTETDDDAVTDLVGLYLRQQHGVELIRRGRWNLPAITAHVRRAMLAEGDASSSTKVVASTPEHAALRRFCLMRGIPLPYRGATRRSAKANGLALALRSAVGVSRAPRSVLLVSDLDGIEDSEPLLSAIKLLRMRQHDLAVVFPAAASFAAPPTSALERDLQHVYGMYEESRHKDMRSEFQRLGVPLITLDAQRGSAEVIRKIANLRRVA